METRPIVGITMGDPAGIGCEIIAKVLSHPTSYERCRPLIIGDLRAMERAIEATSTELKVRPVTATGAAGFSPGIVDVIEACRVNWDVVQMGRASPEGGRAAIACLRKAVDLALSGDISAILSAPVHKGAMHEAGFRFSDECEMLGAWTRSSPVLMLLLAGEIRMATVSPLHISVRAACESLAPDGILASLRVLDDALRQLLGEAPRIGVAALNPHAGEGGLFGREEIEAIAPGVAAARVAGIDARGPFPADTVFVRALRKEFDAVLTMYHDQGRIAMKALGFGKVVVFAIGVPFPFVTTGHGTAFGKAGKGTADPGNLAEALAVAASCAERPERDADARPRCAMS